MTGKLWKYDASIRFIISTCVVALGLGVAMVFRGHVHNGVVQFDDPVALPEGVAVNVELVSSDAQALPKPLEESPAEGQASIEAQLAEIWQDLPAAEWGKLPADLSDQLDHYVYGTPKK